MPRRSPWLLTLVACALVAGPAVAQAAPGDTTRVSVGATGTQADGQSTGASVSADGRFVVFRSASSNLPGAVGFDPAVYLRDRQALTTVKISLDSTSSVGLPAISADGRIVAYAGNDSGVANGDTNGATDILAFDRVTGRTEVVSAGPDERQPGDPQAHFVPADQGSSAERPALSATGRYVAFSSFSTNLVIGGTTAVGDVYVRDRLTRTTELASVDGGGQADGRSFAPAISADGRTVAFASAATDLVAADANAKDDVFVRDLDAGTTSRVSVATGGAEGNLASTSPSISADGRVVAFQSAATTLVAADTNGNDDVFVRDRDAATTTRVSVDGPGAGTQRFYGASQPSISATGRVVAFFSYTDTNGSIDGFDVYTRDRQTATTTKESQGTGGAQAGGVSQFPAISADGGIVAFESTGTNLVAGDTNARVDVFVHERTDPVPVVAMADAYTTDQGQALTVAAPGVLANDAGPGPLAATKVANPAHGTVTLNAGGSFTYAPNAGYTGEDAFTYRAAAGGNVAEVSLHVFRTDLTVTSTAEAGTGSLRWAIEGANEHPGADTIGFAVAGSGVKSITLTNRRLPVITGPVTISGFTQTGASPNTNALGAGSNAQLRVEVTGARSGFTIDADDATLRGFVVDRASPDTDGGTGGNTLAAIDLRGERNVIEGSYLGTNPAGTAAAAPDESVRYFSYGVTVYATSVDNRIGGPQPAARTVISGVGEGVFVLASSTEPPPQNTIIQGTYLGTNAAGTAVPPGIQESTGVNLVSGSSAAIGGGATGAGNVIAGLRSEAIGLGNQTTGTVQGNRIGTQRDGVTPLANAGNAVRISDARNWVIGGTGAGEGNVIADNVGVGVLVSGPNNAANAAGDRNRILGNSIYANDDIGIDLRLGLNGASDVEANDIAPGDPDTGPNEDQNYPVLRRAPVSGGNVTVTGRLPSLFSTTFRVEFFANPSCDPRGNGEGKTFIGFANVTTDPSGDAGFGPLTFAVPAGEPVITATATDPDGNTSEFSRCLRPPVANGDSYSTNQGTALTVGDGASDLLANDTDPDNTADPDADPLTAIKVTDPAHGTVSVNADGSFAYTPAGGFGGSDSFTYAADDGTSSSSPATVTITVAAGPAPAQCADTADNDGDGKTDFPADPGCADAQDDSEAPDPVVTATPSPSPSPTAEATVTASPAPTEAPTATPAPAPATTTPVPTAGPAPGPLGDVSPNDQLSAPEAQLACSTRKIQLVDIGQEGDRARLEGVAARALVGKQVVVEGDWNGRAVARTKVGKDQTFSVLATLPPKAIRTGNRARYTARSAGSGHWR